MKITRLAKDHPAENGQTFYDDDGNVFRYGNIVEFDNCRKAEVFLIKWMRVTKGTLAFKQQSLFLVDDLKSFDSSFSETPLRGGGSLASTPEMFPKKSNLRKLRLSNTATKSHIETLEGN